VGQTKKKITKNSKKDRKIALSSLFQERRRATGKKTKNWQKKDRKIAKKAEK